MLPKPQSRVRKRIDKLMARSVWEARMVLGSIIQSKEFTREGWMQVFLGQRGREVKKVWQVWEGVGMECIWEDVLDAKRCHYFRDWLVQAGRVDENNSK